MFVAALVQPVHLLLGQRQHVFLDAPLDGVGRAGLHARRLKARLDPVDAHVALGDGLGLLVEPRDVEGTPGDAVLTPDAVVLIEVDDAVLVLDNRTRRRTRKQAARLLAVETGVLLDHPAQVVVANFDLVEAHQQPSVRRQVLVALKAAEIGGLLDLQVIPLFARHLAAFAADALRNVDEFRIHGSARPERIEWNQCAWCR